MNRSEHLQWCKERALAYVDEGSNQDAMTSMISDLGKHSGTESSAQIGFSLGMIAMKSGSADEMSQRAVSVSLRHTTTPYHVDAPAMAL